MRGVATRFAALAAASLVAAGCGGGDDGKPKQSAEKTRFVRQVAVICRKADSKLAAEGKKYFSGPQGRSRSQQRFIKDKVVPLFRRDVFDRITRLTPPPGDAAKVRALVASGERAVDRLRSNPDLLRARAGSTQDPFRDFRRRATAYGLKGCGGAGGRPGG